MKNSGTHSSSSESRFLATSFKHLLHKSLVTKSRFNTNKSSKCFNSNENDPPINPNIPLPLDLSAPSKTEISPQVKEDTAPSEGQITIHSEDPAVKVVVRIRSLDKHEKEGDRTIRKISDNSLLAGDRSFTFDSVLDSKSSQDEVFQLVGFPLVKNALAGYNTSILSYGQTGSGKSYTMWGPLSAMVGDLSPSSHQGIVPRIFQMLFSEIQREQDNADGEQINYQCRCSFLEVYNEQIRDLIDPAHMNLQVRDDVRNGLYVENLTEEYVNSYEDVAHLLIKGLSSRKVGVTSINSKSSRSHIVFTCIIESWCKGTSSKGFSRSRTSKISLIDLAGLDRVKPDEASTPCAREGKAVKKSLAQLGYLVNILSRAAQPGKLENVPFGSSCLTHLLRESLGGNAKLSVVCAISPVNKSIAETLSTLRFGQLTKSIRNEPVINEITEDYVNDLSDQIRHLKEELLNAKSSVSSSVGSGYFSGRNVRDSLHQLRVSLNRSLILPKVENEPEGVVVNEDDVKDLQVQLDELQSSCDENERENDIITDSIQFPSIESFETDLTSEQYESCADDSETEETEMKKDEDWSSMVTYNSALSRSLSISSSQHTSVLQDPPLSESPRIRTVPRRSVTVSSNFSSCQNQASVSCNLSQEVLPKSLKGSNNPIRSSLTSSRLYKGPTESLAASLQRGLQIIDYHQRSSASENSAVSFSFEHLTLHPSPAADELKTPDQTLSVDGEKTKSTLFLCASCQNKASDPNNMDDCLKIVTAGDTRNLNRSGGEKPNDENDAYTARRKEELEITCNEQAAKIEQLTLLVEQYKHEKENGSVAIKSDFSSLEAPSVYDASSEYRKLLNFNYDDKRQPEIIKDNCEIKEVQELLIQDSCNLSSNANEKEALLKEIQSLRSKLQLNDRHANRSTEKLRSSLLAQSLQLRKSGTGFQGSSAEELEKERERWMEMESDWISLTDELRIEIETNRRRAEKVEVELKLEKKCTEELNDVLQRAVLGHGRMVEHYAELQEKHNDLVEKHRRILEGIAEVKRAAAKAAAKGGKGSKFSKYFAAELSSSRSEKEKEREFLKKENKSLKLQLRDTAEAVHAAGELLVRLREAEEAASNAEANFRDVEQENDKLKKQLDKVKRKHKMEMVTMKQYLAESRLPESALRPLYKDDSEPYSSNTAQLPDDDQAWRAEFGAAYREY